jgi:hypothetical protein
MDRELSQGMERWLKTATPKQLQETLLRLTLMLDAELKDPDVRSDAEVVVRAIRAEIAIRPTERFLQKHLGHTDERRG